MKKAPPPDLHPGLALFEVPRRMASLVGLARKVFLDRNAQGMNAFGMPRRDRLKVKAEARPHLRMAIRHARASRNALLAGDLALHECERDRARMYLAFARLEVFQRYANMGGTARVKLAKKSAAGVTARAEARKAERNVDRLDGLIEAALEKNAVRPVREWAEAYGRHPSTVYRRIERIERDRIERDRKK